MRTITRLRTSPPVPTRHRAWAGLEVVLAAIIIIADLAIPALVVLLLAMVSLVLRRSGFGSLGFTRLQAPLRSAAQILALTAGWSVLQFGLVMPLLNRTTDSRQDMSVFAELEGDVPLLLGLLLASWTLGALVEETVFRGYLPTRVLEACGTRRAGVLLSVVGPAVLFAAIHAEQGAVGVVLTFLDALFLTWLRYRYRSTWASVLGHGFINTIGIFAFFLVGPLYGLW